MFSYRAKIINQSWRKDSIVRDLRKFRGKFSSIVHMKVKLMEGFEDQVPPTTHFFVGYFVGRQSTKKWRLVSQEDLIAMYSELAQGGKTHVCLWCDGYSEESKNPTNTREMVALVRHQHVLRKKYWLQNRRKFTVTNTVKVTHNID